MRLLVVAMSVSIAAYAATTGGSAEFNPVRKHPHAIPEAAIQHVIVKLRASGSGANPSTSGEKRIEAAQARINALAGRTGLVLDAQRALTANLHVMHVEPALAGESAAATLARLRADPEVEYAELDQRRYAHAAPNDSLYPQQWYMQVSASTPSAVGAVTAWDTTTGSASLVIADLDTGVLFDHPDLQSVAQSGGRLLTGYCFISDSFVANGGACPGAGASDPGDYVTTADLQKPECSNESAASNSSWHGTRTAGILGAITNNNTGIAGMTWQSQILPLRVLGKCGGSDSDIVSAMLWAAGIPVEGVPTNSNPAKIINMSLGGTGACPQTYQDAINQVTAKGVLVVVSAGNEGGPVDAPANCAGVAGVAGLRQAGTKVGFSSLGPQIALSAPAGNCVNTTISATTPCLYSIETTFNLGTTSPGTNTYTDQVNNPNLGTSFSAPIVSGIAALMSAVNGKLNSCQLIARLQEGAQPFPQTSIDATTPPQMCHVPASANDLETSECICTLDGQTCGAGMANAAGAIAAALRPIAALALPSSVAAGHSLVLQGSASAAADGHVISTYQWASVGSQSIAIQGASTSSATVALPACGLATVRLTVTDDAGRQDTADAIVSPTTVTSSAPASAAAIGCTAASSPAILVDVCPGSSSVQAGGGTQSFTATLANTSNAQVSWEVNGVVGGSSKTGTISSAGVYTAPAHVPSPATVTVTALSSADPTASGSTQVTLTSPPGTQSGGGGGVVDLPSLLTFALMLLVGPLRRYNSRCAASSQFFCARR